MLFKVSLSSEIHIVNSKDKASFHEFKTTLPKVFKKLPSRYSLTYVDEDGDEITLTNQGDYNILLQTGMKSTRIYVKEVSEEFFEQTEEIQLDLI